MWFSIHGGNLGAFDFAHSFLDDISALEYTGSVGSHRGEPQESISASLNFVSGKILAEIICDHAVNCSHSHLSCSVLDANSNRVLAHLLTYSIRVNLANCLICLVSPNVSSSKAHNNVSIELNRKPLKSIRHLEFFDSMQFSSCKSQLVLDGAPASAGEFSV